MVAALAIVGAAAVVANSPDVLTSVKVGLPVQLVSTPLVGVPRTGVTITMLVLVQAEITPLVTVPSRGVTNVALVNKLAIDNCLVVLVVACTIGNTSALACVVATGNAEMAMFDI